MPPQINKYYIFDLSPEKSFIQYALKNNLQVVVSWRNPDAQHREWGLSTYVEALDQAIEACREITGSRSVNLAGACAGGLTVAALLGHLQVRRQLRKVASATYLVSLLDSQVESPAMLFADEQTLENSKRRSYQHGVLDGRDMARVFAWMRPNDLIWNYWVNNYARQAAAGVRHPLLEQRQHAPARGLPRGAAGPVQAQPADPRGALEVGGTPVDLGKVAIDSFHVAGITDHHALGRGLPLGPCCSVASGVSSCPTADTSRASSTHPATPRPAISRMTS
ncbi:poly(3-hydroxyalkanoic acid) synthase 2 [Pseudomonas aeruginosa]|nr:poly(3-hydroxyalkanoic acid) synthase 2 [Pseudomonas aeruginosa]